MDVQIAKVKQIKKVGQQVHKGLVLIRIWVMVIKYVKVKWIFQQYHIQNAKLNLNVKNAQTKILISVWNVAIPLTACNVNKVIIKDQMKDKTNVCHIPKKIYVKQPQVKIIAKTAFTDMGYLIIAEKAYVIASPDQRKQTTLACFDGYYDSFLQSCVNKCSSGKYGQCDINCLECSSETECTTCKQDYYLSVTNQNKRTGQCLKKAGQFAGNLHVQSIFSELQEEIIEDGSVDYPFRSLITAINRAYELGAPFEQATITILLFSNQTHSMMRYDTKLRLNEQIDRNSQSTKIIIDSIDQVPVLVNYKLRDKYHFNVGGGLTIRNIEFDAIDSILDEREGNIDSTLIGSNDYSCLQNPIKKCQVQTIFLKTIQQKVIFRNFIYSMRSLIELNEFGGHVEVINTQFININTCGSLIGHKKIDLSEIEQYGYATSNSYLNQIYMTQKSLFQSNNLDSNSFQPFAGACSNDCHSIKIGYSTFKQIVGINGIIQADDNLQLSIEIYNSVLQQIQTSQKGIFVLNSTNISFEMRDSAVDSLDIDNTQGGFITLGSNLVELELNIKSSELNNIQGQSGRFIQLKQSGNSIPKNLNINLENNKIDLSAFDQFWIFNLGAHVPFSVWLGLYNSRHFINLEQNFGTVNLNMTSNTISTSNIFDFESLIYAGNGVSVQDQSSKLIGLTYQNENDLPPTSPVAMIFCDSCNLTLNKTILSLYRNQNSSIIIAKDASNVILEGIEIEKDSNQFMKGSLLTIIGADQNLIQMRAIDFDISMDTQVEYRTAGLIIANNSQAEIKIEQSQISYIASGFAFLRILLIKQLDLLDVTFQETNQLTAGQILNSSYSLTKISMIRVNFHGSLLTEQASQSNLILPSLINLQGFDSLIITQSTFQNIQGRQLLFMQNGNYIEISANSIQCSAQSFDSSYTSTTYLEANETNFLSSDFPSQFSSPAEFKNVTDIKIELSMFQNCYNRQMGGAMKITDSKASITSSQFYFNQAMIGGSIFCYNCTIQFSDVDFNNSFALKGGSVYLNNSLELVFSNCQLLNSVAYDSGGFIYLDDGSLQAPIYSTQKIVKFTENCGFSNTYALNLGGAIFVNNSDYSIEILSTTQYNSIAFNQMGGFIHLQNAKSLKIIESNFVIFKSYQGDFVSSLGDNTSIEISFSQFMKNLQPLDKFPANFHLDSSSFGPFYFKDSLSVTFNQLDFINGDYKVSAGVVDMINTTFIDNGSTYRYSIGGYAGVMKLYKMKGIKISNILTEYNMGGNFSSYSGIFISYPEQDTILTNITFKHQKGYSGPIFYERDDSSTKPRAVKLIINQMSVENCHTRNENSISYYDPNGILLVNGLLLNYTLGFFQGLITIRKVRMAEIFNVTIFNARTSYESYVLLAERISESIYLSNVTMNCSANQIQNKNQNSESNSRFFDTTFNIQDFQYSPIVSKVSTGQSHLDKFRIFDCKFDALTQFKITEQARGLFIAYSIFTPSENPLGRLLAVIQDTRVISTRFINTNSYYQNLSMNQQAFNSFNLTRYYFENNTYLDLRGFQRLLEQDNTIGIVKNISVRNLNFNHIDCGVFKTFGTYFRKQSLYLKNSDFQNLQFVGKGGLMSQQSYVDYIKMDNIYLKNITTTDLGGVLYIQYESNLNLTYIHIKNSYFVDFRSPQNQGDFLYSDKLSAYIEISNTTIQCSSTNAQQEYSSSNVGVIYFANSIYGLKTKNSIIKQCFYKTGQGLVMNIQNTFYNDTGSTFEQIKASNGAAIHCYDCDLNITKTTFKSIKGNYGGSIFADGLVTIYINQAFIEDSTAISDGGFIAFRQVNEEIKKMSYFQIQNSKVIGTGAERGGFIYASNSYLQISFVNINAQQISSTINGGFISITSATNITFQNSQFQEFKSTSGGFMFSFYPQLGISMTGSTFECNTFENYLVSKDSLSSDYTDSYFFLKNADKITSQNNKFRYCGMTQTGGVFSLQRTIFSDQKSTFQLNSGFNGGVINIQESQAVFYQSKFISNQAKIGGAIYATSQSNVTINQCQSTMNSASSSGGVIYLSQQSNLQIRGSDFNENKAPENSVLEIQGSNLDYSVLIKSSNFFDNIATSNTLSLINTNVLIQDCSFKSNLAQVSTKNILCEFSNLTVENTIFDDSLAKYTTTSLQDEETTGSFIYLRFSTNLIIKKCKFSNAIAYYGGALYISSDSSADIEESQFLKNKARSQGGSIYASGFESIYIGKNTIFKDNSAVSEGEDIYLTNSVNLMTLNQVQISNINAKNSIYIEQAKLYANQIVIEDIYMNKDSIRGGAINCQYCTGIEIYNSKFRNLRSSEGGAIYMTESDFNKGSTQQEINQKFQIKNSLFQNCTAQRGGAIMIQNSQSTVLVNNQFLENKALIIKDQSTQEQNQGAGGAIYYTCDEQILNCLLKFDGVNTFSDNRAQIQGGVIYWDTLEPIYQLNNMKFSNNSAQYYGDIIACFASKLGLLNYNQYKDQMIKLNIKSAEEFDYRMLDAINSSSSVPITEQNVQNQRSGGSIQNLYATLLDKYGQIVGSDFSSKVRLQVNITNLDSNASKYPPILEGSSDFVAQGGVAVIQGVSLTGSPGSSYKVIITTDGIDTNKQANKNASQSATSDDPNFQIQIKLRECEIGEQFTSEGKCQQCQDSFLLVKQNEPGICETCPSEKALCKGGSNIGPLPGYWRRDSSTKNFEVCLFKPACLGMVPPNNNPVGECYLGYRGILCADCQVGFSKYNEYQCSYCPKPWLNILRLFAIFLGVVLVVVVMIRSTLNGAKNTDQITSIYLKILLNHFQLLLMTASLDFSWSEEIVNFFKATNQVATVSTQVFSVDCFLDTRTEKNESSMENRIFFMKLVIVALLPFFLSLACKLFWMIYNGIKKTISKESSKEISSIVIVLFLAHPSIVQYTFRDFKCLNVDGEERVQDDLEIICWESAHKFFSYFVAIPSIILWVLGIPFFALVILIRNRGYLQKLHIREKYGFLYRGYKQEFYFWEIVIMYRKIAIIFVSVFIGSVGIMAQALLMFTLIIWSLMINTKFQPFSTRQLNDLESLSLATSLVTIYCGIFFILNQPQSWIDSDPENQIAALSLNASLQSFFFSVILIANLLFFLYWAIRMYYEMRARFRSQFQKIYLVLCLCFDKSKLEGELKAYELELINRKYEEEFQRQIKQFRNIFESKKMHVNEKVISKLKILFDERNLDQILGITQKVQDQTAREKRISRNKRIKLIPKNDQKDLFITDTNSDNYDDSESQNEDTQQISVDSQIDINFSDLNLRQNINANSSNNSLVEKRSPAQRNYSTFKRNQTISQKNQKYSNFKNKIKKNQTQKLSKQPKVSIKDSSRFDTNTDIISEQLFNEKNQSILKIKLTRDNWQQDTIKESIKIGPEENYFEIDKIKKYKKLKTRSPKARSPSNHTNKTKGELDFYNQIKRQKQNEQTQKQYHQDKLDVAISDDSSDTNSGVYQTEEADFNLIKYHDQSQDKRSNENSEFSIDNLQNDLLVEEIIEEMDDNNVNAFDYNKYQESQNAEIENDWIQQDLQLAFNQIESSTSNKESTDQKSSSKILSSEHNQSSSLENLKVNNIEKDNQKGWV
ncbi:UNKNOWN [Stylonychia lemnae]|uniref:Transmembrane protein n=1 Tax=Stylonychia lemnae TaxID=5949 RepID=A0A078B389_STYLE|nr:UNKNOWN [Stylonychia lemnae]|eukprot:CDW87963.1 UNKNOWN [Stylonychia lemnae]